LIVAFGFRLRSHLGRLIDQTSRRFGDSIGRVGRHAQNRWPALGAGAAAGIGRGHGGGFGLATTAREWSLDYPGGQYMWNRLYARHFTRGYRRGRGYPGATRRPLRRVDAAGHRIAGAGTTAARTAGRVARAAVMAPVLGPQAYAATRVRATAASTRARARLQRARATRQQWLHNTRHPIQAMQTAHRQATPAAAGRPPDRSTRTRRPPAADASTAAPRSRMSWWIVPGTPYRQPELDFASPPVTYEQQSFALDERRPRRPEPPRRPPRTETYDQPGFDFSGWQLQFDIPASARHGRRAEGPSAPRSGADQRQGGEQQETEGER
jgi:hypothetical protein